jgi:hypothetical protein
VLGVAAVVGGGVVGAELTDEGFDVVAGGVLVVAGREGGLI